MATPLKFDEIGYWSEIKLDILKEYASAYSTIFSSKKQARFSHVYIDGFAGAGVHISKATKEYIPGSPLNALLVEPPFEEYFLIDMDGDKIEGLGQMVGKRDNVHLYQGDCNVVLLRDVFPNVRYEDYRRGLCLLDPYGLHLSWEVIRKASEMQTIDMFLNFPIMDMNRNVLWNNPDNVADDDIGRMNCFWGNETWRKAAYRPVEGLFETMEEKSSNETIAKAFQKRLKDSAGFKYVPDPLPMRNTKGAIVYYLFFASHNQAAKKIIQDIFTKYATQGG